MSAEPPPAHRPHSLVSTGTGFPPGSYPGTPSQTPPPVSPANLAQIQQQRDQQQQSHQQQQQQQQQRDRVTLPGKYDQSCEFYTCLTEDYKLNEFFDSSLLGHAAAVPVSSAPLPAHSGGMSASMTQQQQTTAGRNLQASTPPVGVVQMPASGQTPTQSDSLEALLQRYPVMWQGLLALKNDQAAVQMHFVHGNPGVAGSSLPSNSDGTTPPLRIAQRMRLEPAQIDGVARKMQVSRVCNCFHR